MKKYLMLVNGSIGKEKGKRQKLYKKGDVLTEHDLGDYAKFLLQSNSIREIVSLEEAQNRKDRGNTAGYTVRPTAQELNSRATRVQNQTRANTQSHTNQTSQAKEQANQPASQPASEPVQQAPENASAGYGEAN